MTTTTLTGERVSLGLARSFRGLVHYCRGGKHGSTQGDVVAESSRSSSSGSKEREKDTGFGLSF